MKMELNVIKELKPGGQKSVYLVEHNGKIMIYKKGKCKTANGLKRIIREVNILKTIESEFFPKNYFFSYDEANGEFDILEEYIDGNTLSNCMNDYESEKDI